MRGIAGLDVPLRASGVPAAVSLVLAPGTLAAATHVLSPIELRGETTLEDAHLVVAREVPGVPVALRPGAPVLRPAVRDAAFFALVVVEGSRQSPGVSLYVPLGCADVALGGYDEPPPEESDLLPTHDITTAQDLPLAAEPGGATVVTLALADAHLPIQVTVVEERDGWSHVVRRFYWANVDGWVPSDRVRATPDPAWHLPSLGGWGSGSGCGRSEHPYVYRGPATVRAGTVVRDEHTGVAWGRFVADTEVEIGIRANDPGGDAEVIHAEGLETVECSSLEYDHAIVPHASIVLPP